MACTVCPRNCSNDRTAAAGFCGCFSVPKVARAALHFDEEPCISGTRGSGTIFFSGCNLKCVFCQNIVLQDGTLGEPSSAHRLAEIMLKLRDKGAHNINLVTPTPHRDTLIPALRMAKASGLSIPVLYNTNAYETVETIRAYEGLIDLYLPDLKYHDERLAKKLSGVSDYFTVAMDVIAEMVRQTGFMQTDENGLAFRGVRIRHLVLPGCVFDTRAILDAVRDRFGVDMPLSLMAQYTPIGACKEPPFDRRLTKREYELAASYCRSLGFTDVFLQGADSAEASYTPPFSDHIEL